jgi:hypothetical protein
MEIIWFHSWKNIVISMKVHDILVIETKDILGGWDSSRIPLK